MITYDNISGASKLRSSRELANAAARLRVRVETEDLQILFTLRGNRFSAACSLGFP